MTATPANFTRYSFAFGIRHIKSPEFETKGLPTVLASLQSTLAVAEFPTKNPAKPPLSTTSPHQEFLVQHQDPTLTDIVQILE